MTAQGRAMNFGLSPAQVALRRTGIGGSDAGAIVAGGDEWPKLWLEKTGRKPADDLSNILPVIMGSYTEPLNCWWFEQRTGREVTRKGERVIHPDHPFPGREP